MVEVRSFFRRSDGSFVPFGEMAGPVEDCRYVPGAIELWIGGVEVLSLELWDDINWLWPFVVQPLDECRRERRTVLSRPASEVQRRVSRFLGAGSCVGGRRLNR